MSRALQTNGVVSCKFSLHPQEISKELENESSMYRSLEEEASLMHHILTEMTRHDEEISRQNGKKWKLPPYGQPISLFSGGPGPQRMMKPQDDSKFAGYSVNRIPPRSMSIRPPLCVFVSVIFRVYCADHTYCTLRMPLNSTAETIKLSAADRLKLRNCDDLALAEVKSSGERIVIKDQDVNVPTALSLNGRLFVSPKDHLDALVRLGRSWLGT